MLEFDSTSTIPPALQEIRDIFDEACTRRGLASPSLETNELARAMLDAYTSGIRDRQSFRYLAKYYP
jgi:hypothetical protein